MQPIISAISVYIVSTAYHHGAWQSGALNAFFSNITLSNKYSLNYHNNGNILTAVLIYTMVCYPQRINY